VRRRAEQLLQDVRMLVALDETRLRRAEGKKGTTFDVTGPDARYAALFRWYGIDVLALSPAEAAAHIRNSVIHEALLAGLDGWIEAKLAPDRPGAPAWGKPKPDADRAHLAWVADAADDNAWRRAFRAALLALDEEKLKVLAGQPEALEQPPTVVAALASVLHGCGLHSGDATVSAALLRRAQPHHPTDFWINYLLGAALVSCPPGQARPEEAVGYFRAAVAIRPTSAEAHDALGYALRRMGEPEAAIVALQRAVALDPEFALAQENLGEALREKGDKIGAFASFKKAIELGSDDIDACFGLGWALETKGNHDEAIADLRKAIECKPDFAAAVYCGLGYAFLAKGRHDEAIADLRKAIELKPDFAEVYNVLGWVLLNSGRDEEAIAPLRKAIELKPDFAPAYHNLAFALSAKGRLDQAEHVFSELVEVRRRKDPKLVDFPDSAVALAQNLLKLEKYSGPGGVLSGFLTFCAEKLPDDWRRFNTHSILGGALLGQKKYAAAGLLLLQGYEGMMQRERQIPPRAKFRLTEAAERLARFYEATNQSEKARAWRRKVESSSQAGGQSKGMDVQPELLPLPREFP
jgi:tetratricopeptide (TPR) repeat protein